MRHISIIFNVSHIFHCCGQIGHLLAGGTLDICQHGEVIPHTSKACQNLDDRGKHVIYPLLFFKHLLVL